MTSAATPAMFPVMLDITGLPTMLIGGASLAGRLAALDDHGARAVHVFADNPSPDLAQRAGARLTPRLPEESDFALIRPRVVFIADLDEATATLFHDRGRSAGALIHVQDQRRLCDFHLPAILRRGKLQLTVSTDGVAAGLSRLLRDHLKETIGPEWAERVEEVAAARERWKAEGLSTADLARAVEGLVAEHGWFAKTRQ
jgi:precorrin-2 dehydrogenase / sirohydrochlorin ferrochelatase